MATTFDRGQFKELLSRRLTELLIQDEDGWASTAERLATKAMEMGIDIYADYESPREWSRCFADAMRFHVNYEELLCGEAQEERLHAFESAEGVFWWVVHPLHTRDDDPCE